MLPQFMAEDQIRRENGVSHPVDISSATGQALLLTLGITRIIQQESLDVEIHGSADGEQWTPRPIASFPKKYYCGTYSLILDLSEHPGLRFVRASWRMSHWGRGPVKPLFSFYLWTSPTAHDEDHEMADAEQYMSPATSVV